jgi:hypothetical protein
VEICAACSLVAPAGWQVDEAQRKVTVPPCASIAVDWTVTAPPPGHLENTNTLYLQIAADERPAQPAVPIVLIGARRFRFSGPYTNGAAADLYAQVLPPEARSGSEPAERGGEWHDGAALDNALPLADALAGGGALYVQTFLWSPAERAAVLGAPGNCPRKLWLNGELLATPDNDRPIRPNYNGDGQSYAPVTLKSGWNEVLIKYVRIADAAPFAGHLILVTPDDLRTALVDVGWTRLPWDPVQ